jgi:hypothetical protein
VKLSGYRKGAKIDGQPLPQPVESRSIRVDRGCAHLSRLLPLIILFCGCVGGPVPDPPNIKSNADEPTEPYANAGTAQPGSTATVNTVKPSDTLSGAEDEMSDHSGYAGAAGSLDPTVVIVAGSGGAEAVIGGSQDAGTGNAAAAPSEDTNGDNEFYPPFDPLTIANIQVNSIIDLSFAPNYPSILVIQGKPAALSAGQVLWVFNLDTIVPPSFATAAEDGSFEIQIIYRLGDVLRFQVRQGEIYYEPADLELSEDSMTLVPIEQVECISIPTQLALEQSAPLVIVNQCEEAITVLDIAWRTEGVPIAVEDATGVVIYPSSARELNLLVTSNEVQPWINEDILLITIGLGSEEIRFATSVTIK